MSKVVFIVRGVSGAGKSTLAAELNAFVCSNDYYHINNGVYKFDYHNIDAAVKSCWDSFCSAIDRGEERIVVDNTNTTEDVFVDYIKHAESNGYTVFCMIVENRHGNSNIHNVPNNSREKMKRCIMSNIKLM